MKASGAAAAPPAAPLRTEAPEPTTSTKQLTLGRYFTRILKHDEGIMLRWRRILTFKQFCKIMRLSTCQCCSVFQTVFMKSVLFVFFFVFLGFHVKPKNGDSVCSRSLRASGSYVLTPAGGRAPLPGSCSLTARCDPPLCRRIQRLQAPFEPDTVTLRRPVLIHSIGPVGYHPAHLHGVSVRSCFLPPKVRSNFSAELRTEGWRPKPGSVNGACLKAAGF